MGWWKELIKGLFVMNDIPWRNPQMNEKELIEYFMAHGISMDERGNPANDKSAKKMRKIIEDELKWQ